MMWEMITEVLYIMTIMSLGIIAVVFMLTVIQEFAKSICRHNKKENKKKEDKYRKYICPVCNSSMLKYTIPETYGLRKNVCCNKCGFSLTFGNDKDFEEYRKYYKKRHKLNNKK